MSKRIIFFTLILLIACWSGETSATMVNILGNNGAENLGFFSGTLSYNPIDAHDATLTIILTNTGSQAMGGYLTALAFNNPANDITGVSLGTTPATGRFQLLGAASGGKHSPPGFQNGISAPPYGNFDLGASTSKDFLGGGNPNAGIAPGQSVTFSFALTGNHLNDLTSLSFTQELSSGGQFFLARFRGFDNKGSDKVPGFGYTTPTNASHAPIPSTLILCGSVLAGLAIRRFMKS